MYRVLRIFHLLMLILLLVYPAAGTAFEGPLQSKNQFPLFLHLNAPVHESALTESSFSVSLSHSSIFMLENSAEWTANLDMEITELRMKYMRDIQGLFEIGIEIPVLMFSSGFMDSALDRYHRTFGFPDYGRNRRPDNEFLYEVRRNGKLIVKANNGEAGPGDIRVSIRKAILKSDPYISIKADLELPTGSASKGFGNGRIDSGISLLMDKHISELFRSYFILGAVFPGDLHAKETVRLRSYLYSGAALEAAIWKNFSLLGQVSFQNSPFPETRIGPIDRIASLLTLGVRYSSDKNVFEFSLSEDVNTAGAPDVTFNFAYKRKL
jgi:hypothetical protein